MDHAKIIALIASLYAAEVAVRAEMVKNAAKENNMKEGDLFKLLKLSGYDPKASKGTAAPISTDVPPPDDKKDDDPPDDKSENGEKKQSVTLRHKTEYPRYRRAGLVLTNQFKPYEVTEGQLAILKEDLWVEIGK